MVINKRIDLLFFLAVCYLPLACCGNPQLNILPAGNNIGSPAGQSFTLVCSATSVDDDDDEAFTDMNWIDPKGDIISDRFPDLKVASSKNSLKLTFVKPQLVDSGQYNCSAMYMDTTVLHTGTFVQFYEDIEWVQCEEEQSLVLGREGMIFCKATGNPSPVINWAKDGISLPPERYIVGVDGTSISNVEKDDRGRYSVEAFVPVTGRTSYKFIEVTVQIPPKIIEIPDELRAIEGEQYVLRCQAEGFPMPKYTWLDPLQRDLSVEGGFEVNSDEGLLTINKVQRDIGGEYTCKAENPAGEDKRSLKVTVVVKPSIIQFDNKTKEEGATAIFECLAEGDPAPELTIRKEGKTNFEGNEEGRISLQETDSNGIRKLTLTINNVKHSDDGLYFCSAENDASRVERAGHLQVLFAPNMSATPLREVKTWESNSVNLSCIAEANPNASLVWKFRNEDIDPKDSRFIVYGEYSYSNLFVNVKEMGSFNRAYGTYTCLAKNALGDASVDIQLEEATKPGPLSQVMFEKVTPTTITFRLLGPSNDGGMPIISYVVKYRMDGEPESEEHNKIWPKGSSFTLNELKPRTKYKFKFAAKNVVGTGAWKDETYVLPFETSPDPPVFITGMEAPSDYPDRFEIKWIPPEDNGKKIDFFEIRYFEVEPRVEQDQTTYDKIGDDTKVKIEDWSIPVYELGNLSPSTYYKVELRAHNSVGYSFPGVVVFRTRSGEVQDGQTSVIENGIIPLHGIIAIAVVAVLIILIAMDITCYLRYHCGLLYVIRYQSCGRSPSSEKVKDVVIEDGRGCVKEVSTANNGKIKTEIKPPSPKATSPVQPPPDKPPETFEEKSKAEMDNPAFDDVRDNLKNMATTDNGFPFEDTPMLSFAGNKDTRPADLIVDSNYKNKSPKGSKSSLGKSSPV